MKLSEKWIEQAFNAYNAKYFGGKLPMPYLTIKTLPNEWGRYIPNTMENRFTGKVTKILGPGEIILSDVKERGEKGYANTLIHEMIHEYVFLILRKGGNSLHGPEFLQIAQRINADGWNISEYNEWEEDNANENDNVNNNGMSKIGIGAFYKPDGSGYKVWVFCYEVGNKEPYMKTISQMKNVSKLTFAEFGLQSGKEYNGDPLTLTGFGGQTFKEAFKKMQNAIGEKLIKIK